MKAKKITLQLVADGVLVKRVEPSETENGIFIPETYRGDKNVSEGVVLAIGPGRYLPNGDLIPLPYSVGDHIMYGEGRGLDVTIEGQKCRALTGSDVLGFFPPTVN